MVKSKVVRLDPQGIKRVMDIGGPSVLNTTLKKPRKVHKNKSDNSKLIGKSTILTKGPKHVLWSPVNVESDSPSSEYSEMAPIWTDIKAFQSKKIPNWQNHAELSQPRLKYALLAIRALPWLQMYTAPKVELKL
jgi:hypothetical protein